jgi:glycine/D-amino acid oxidase-like deaminating enzyme
MAFTVPKNVVVVGAGIQGVSVAYHMAKSSSKVTVTLLEAERPASAASGKGGGFMARSWGDGVTQRLHELSFDLYEQLAVDFGCTSYRKLPVLSVSPGYDGIKQAKKDKQLAEIMPEWLDSGVGRIGALGLGDDTAQITPKEFVDKMMEKEKLNCLLGTCIGVEHDQGSARGARKITAVRYIDRRTGEEASLPADAIVVSCGPWSVAVEDWFPSSNLQIPMEGIKSTSIVWKKPDITSEVDATVLFCGEDHRFGTHRKYCQPRL